MIKKEDEDKKLKELMKNPEYQEMYAKQYASPAIQAANTYITFKHKEEPLDCGEITKELTAQNKALRNNDLTRIEDILMAQAQTLDFLFHREARLAAAQEHMLQFKAHMDMAFKAQRQCRATIEALAFIKNPQPYVRQQNVAQQQIVNNGSAPARAEKTRKQSNELLEDKSHELTRMDTGAPGAAGGGDTTLETVEKIDGAENP